MSGALLILASGMSGAAIVASYDFSTNLNSADPELGASAGVLTRGSFTGGSGSITEHAARSTGNGNFFVRTRLTPATLTEAITNESYVQFTVTPGSTPLTLTTLAFAYGMHTGSEFAFSGGMAVRSSLDGYASNLRSYTGNSTVGFNPDNSVRTIDFSGALYENLTEPFTIRFYFYDDSDETGNTAVVHRLDNIVLNAVPEPSAFVLVAASIVGLVSFRQRRI